MARCRPSPGSVEGRGLRLPRPERRPAPRRDPYLSRTVVSVTPPFTAS